MDDHQLEALTIEIRKSNRLAFSNFFRTYYAAYVAYSQRFVNSKDQAADIVQEVFVKLWEIRDTLDPDKSLKSLVYAMVRNHSLNHLRDYENRYTDLNEDVLTIHHQQVSTEEQQPDSSIFSELIKELPERQREAFELSRFDGLQHDEIAEIMDVSPRTVNNHIVAALKTLRDAYENYKQKTMNI